MMGDVAKKVHQRCEFSTALQHRIVKTLQYLEKATHSLPRPMGDLLVEKYGRDSFILLAGCLLSLRARDQTVYPVYEQLLKVAKTPQDMVNVPQKVLEDILKPIGFYRKKAVVLHQVSHALLTHYGGKVPHTQKELLSLPGVGLKTAHFMLAYAFLVPALCVDTHVHRLANLFGWVHTKSPEETEKALKKVVPQEWWIRFNTVLVTWGQQVCKPMLARRLLRNHLQHCPCSESFSLE